jgi:hypothetical protein
VRQILLHLYPERGDDGSEEKKKVVEKGRIEGNAPWMDQAPPHLYDDQDSKR